jgi:type I restriction enzyme R subunit
MIVIDKDVMVAMADGVRLATDVFRLQDGPPSPVLLVRTPYGTTVGHAERSGDLRDFLAGVQKFFFILEGIGSEHHQSRFAILIEEAHSRQGGRTTAAMSTALSEVGENDADETVEDQINRIPTARKMLPNASYFAFTATPKNKTLEIFGVPYPADGKTKHRPFHSYTMKQAIERASSSMS